MKRAVLVLLAASAFGQGYVWKEPPLPMIGPSSRHGPAMVYDSMRDKTVLFGGRTYSRYMFDTWEWDGSAWTRRFPAANPAGRTEHAMAYDSVRGRAVLFGGQDNGNRDDTWEWDGTSWTQPLTKTAPVARRYHAMAYDSQRGKTILFGGNGGSSGYLNDTWEWDGSLWVERTPPVSPSPRFGMAMVFDLRRGKVVLFGGYHESSIYYSETWEWDGTTWSYRSPVMRPPARALTAAAYDYGRGRAILFGGGSAGPDLGDTWEWDGTEWMQSTTPGPGCPPEPRAYHALAYHGVRGTTVLFGGGAGYGLPDTWEYGPITATPPCTVPCCSIGPGHLCTWRVALVCATRPSIGSEFRLTLYDPEVGAGLAILHLGPRLDPPITVPWASPFCRPGSIFAFASLVLLAVGNPATFAIQIPNEMSLIGQTVAVQGASYQLSPCFRLTDGLAVTVQP